MKKKIVIIIGVLLIVFLLANIATHTSAKKDLLGFFFDGEKNETTVQNSLLTKSNQKKVIDDYTITLEESLCEKNTQLGYLVFSVKKAGGKPEADIVNDGILRAFGENNRFTFDYEATGSFNKFAEYDGDVLYVYISFEADKKKNENYYLSNCVNITDLSENNDEEYKQYTFDLQYSDECKAFQAQEGILYISPLGCKFVMSKTMENLDVKIKNADGDILLNKQSFSEAGSKKEEVTEIHYTNMFEDLLDISTIDEVWLDNQKLTEVEL